MNVFWYDSNEFLPLFIANGVTGCERCWVMRSTTSRRGRLRQDSCWLRVWWSGPAGWTDPYPVQFMSRMTRTKGRIQELEAKIRASTSTADAGLGLRLLVEYYQKLAANLGPQLQDADWDRRREVIRGLVDRIEIGPETIVIIFRVPGDIASSVRDPVVVILSRPRRSHGLAQFTQRHPDLSHQARDNLVLADAGPTLGDDSA